MAALQPLTNWPLLGLALFPIAAAILLVMRHRNARAFLFFTAYGWTLIGPGALLAAVLAPIDGQLPPWVAPTIILGLAAGMDRGRTAVVGAVTCGRSR